MSSWRRGCALTVALLLVGQQRLAAQGISSVTFSPNGKLLLVGDDSGRLTLYDASTKEAFFSPPGWHGWGPRGTFSPDGKTLAVRSRGLALWDLSTGRRTGLPFPKDQQLLAYSPDGKQLATLDKGTTVRVWPVGGGKARLALEPFKHALSQAVFLPDNQALLAVGWDAGSRDRDVVRLCDLKSGKFRDVWKTPAEGKAAVRVRALSPGGRWVVLSDPSREALRLLDVRTGKTSGPLPVRLGTSYDDSFAFAPDDKMLAIETGDGKVWLYDLTGPSPRKRRVIDAVADWRSPRICLAFSHDGKVLGIGTSVSIGGWGSTTFNTAGRLECWDAITGKKLPWPKEK